MKGFYLFFQEFQELLLLQLQGLLSLLELLLDSLHQVGLLLLYLGQDLYGKVTLFYFLLAHFHLGMDLLDTVEELGLGREILTELLNLVVLVGVENGAV